MSTSTWQRLHQNPRLFPQYFIRGQVIQAIRDFFLSKQFREVEVPLLSPALPAESYLEIFETTLLDRHRNPKRAFLTCSPEIFQKKLLVAGMGDNFTITKSFRNTEDLSSTHNPEFTLLEWYEVDKDYKDVMKTTEKLFCFIYDKMYSSSPDYLLNYKSYRGREVTISKGRSRRSLSRTLLRDSNNNYTMTYQGQAIDLTPPWERLSVTEAFGKYAKVDLEENLTLEPMKQAARAKGYQLEEKTTWEELFNQMYLNEVEPHFGKGRPTIIYDFPSPMGALAKKKDSDPRFAERFEVYIAGLELGDCYSELTDWKEQEERFKREIEEIKRLGKTVYPYDKDFIEALKVGLPKCSGLALGVDRTVMLFADVPTIQDTLFFPAREMWK